VKEYQRFLAPGFTPFDPLELARETEGIVTREGSDGLERKYVGIYSAPVYGGIATGYASGCCLRCIYCWSNWSRDYPERFGEFFSPKEVAERLFKAAREGITASGWKRFKHVKVNKLRVSGCEPTLGKEHLLRLLEHVKESGYPFYLETNGVLFGADSDYVKRLSEYSHFIYVRVSFKAATPEGFTGRTGAIGKYYDLPFKALKLLLDRGIYAKAAAMTDPNVMPPEERSILIARLNQIGPSSRYPETLEEESVDAYGTTLKRLKAFSSAEYAEKLEREILRRHR
jgi:uncharacterized Fe-S cluster-containing radical SAM superfamily protein